MKKPLVLIFILIGSIFSCCRQQTEAEEKVDIGAIESIFPQGNKGPSELFVGNAYNYGLVPNDTIYNTLIGNVYFEPGARSNWHTHPGGQILIITAGKGYHQIEGEPIQLLEKGDVAKCPPNTRHWHGASPDTGMQQLYIVTNTDKGIVDWMEKVSDEQYAK